MKNCQKAHCQLEVSQQGVSPDTTPVVIAQRTQSAYLDCKLKLLNQSVLLTKRNWC